MSNVASFHPRHMLPKSVPKVKNFAKFRNFDTNQAGQQCFLFLQSHGCQKWKKRFQTVSESID